VIKAIWNAMNGLKLSTGLVVTIAGIVLQNAGMSHDQAIQTVSLIMQGIGGITTLVGFIHQIIKKNQPAK
jgi:hypothetical protein